MKRLLYFFFILLTGCTSEKKPFVEKVLLTDGWEFQKIDAGRESWHKAFVPGSIHTDLLKNKLIPDPFHGCNEKKLQWIGQSDWKYRKTFCADSGLLQKQNIRLVFEGLDTYARILLNGEKVLETNNMFRKWSVNIKPFLREGENLLEVVFSSAEEQYLKDSLALDYPLPGGKWVFARKAACHFGWDWGPKYVTAGIWKPVYLEIWEKHSIVDIHLSTTSITPERAVIKGSVSVHSSGEEKAEIKVKNLLSKKNLYIEKVMLHPKKEAIHFTFSLEDPILWWSNGLGEPYLYPFEIIISGESGYEYSQQIDYGIRTIELVQERDEYGQSFYFKLNGEKIFIKGANIIPPHSFMTEVTREQYAGLVQLAAKSNMNMLRVWGGGVYLDDDFYHLCDKHGIMVWQDFMFACAMYPGDTAFLENVRQEAEHQVKRLRNHASIALWCGNNEIDEGWKNWGWQQQYKLSAKDSAMIWGNYQRLFHQLLPEIVTRYDNQCHYIPTSPLNGWGRKESMTFGDSHYWGVWWGKEPFEIYLEKVPRFMSEFGFQAMPALSTIRTMQPPEEDSLFSSSIRCHQKHPTGFETIGLYLEREDLFPKTLEHSIYFSQLVQAKGIGMAIEAHRRAMPYCMGSLYWQLNDCWPVTSWSGTDFYGNQKALQYEVEKCFKDILVSVVMKNDTGSVYLISDRLKPVDGLLELQLTDFHGKNIWRYERASLIPACTGKHVLSFSRKGILAGHDPAACLLKATFRTEEDSYESTQFFTSYGKLQLSDAELNYTILPSDDGFEIEISSDNFAAFVYLYAESSPLVFSNNFFHVRPGEKTFVKCTTNLTLEDFGQQLKVKHLKVYLGEGI